MSPERVVLVTGGAGFVGAETVRRLAARGDEVHVLGRASTDRAPLAALAVRWHLADLEDARAVLTALRAAATGAQALGVPLDVVHLAARISYRRRDRELLRRVNVEGTRHVLAGAQAAGVRRFCHVSSVVALGPVSGADEEKDDDAPLGGWALSSAYARTKAEAEELVLAAGDALEVVVASPAVVFGVSAAHSNSLHFLERIRRGSLRPLSPPGSLSVVGLDDAAAGIVAVLERGVCGRRYLLCESAWRLDELLQLVCELCGRRPPWGRVPRPVWGALTRVVALAERVRPGERVTSEALALLGMHFRFRARRARAELGWEPRAFRVVLGELLERLEVHA